MKETKQTLVYLTEILVEDVMNKGYNVITYDNLGATLSRKYEITIPPLEVSRLLEDVSYICFVMELPLISALVVRRETYQPDERFYKQYEELRDLRVMNKKETHIKEVKKVMACQDWQKLLLRLKSGEKIEKPIQQAIATKQVQVSPATNEMMDEETFLNEMDKKIKEATALGPVLRRDHLESNTPKKRVVTKTVYEVNPNIVAEVMYRANGVCENCGQLAPFRRKDDYSAYLEVIYKIPFKSGGEDSLKNAIAVCPNCHMQKCYGN